MTVSSIMMSQMHFDDDELYTANSYSGTNLYYVATHEFGHVLGIRHTNIRGAVMYPYYPGLASLVYGNLLRRNGSEYSKQTFTISSYLPSE